MDINQIFHGPNAGYLLEQYDLYCRDATSVDAELRVFFQTYADALSEAQPDTHSAPSLISAPSTAGAAASVSSVALQDNATAAAYARLASAIRLGGNIRRFGHLAAHLDPLGFYPIKGDPALNMETYGLTLDELQALPGEAIRGPQAQGGRNAAEVISALRQIYCHHIGYDYDHIRPPEQRDWLREAAESRRFTADDEPETKRALLRRLVDVEAFEQFLNLRYPAKTRFSIEGLDMLVPMLDEVILLAAHTKIYDVVIGMAHRGRLNALAHILERPYEQILSEFKDQIAEEYIRNHAHVTGDVKYHHGGRRYVKGDAAFSVTVSMVPNPSHLEHVNPVVTGIARAAGTQRHAGPKAVFDPGKVLPILIHGDAAVSGQGIVAETLNFSYLRGYRTGGTLHIIANNQVGFTTRPDASRSTHYASDIFKGYQMPIIHVNASDPLACIEVIRIAAEFIFKFRKDFVIDLIGYRAHGHNEGDDPEFTQPRMYQLIKQQPTVRSQFAAYLNQVGIVSAAESQAWYDGAMQKLQTIWEGLEKYQPEKETPKKPPRGAAKAAQTNVSVDVLRTLNQAVLTVPAGFNINERLNRVLEKRLGSLSDVTAKTVDWATAELLAYASIVSEGIACRLTGEDVERGTFSHRHAVWSDQVTGESYVPLHHLPQSRASFEIRNSALSENAALGFEFGYSVGAPDCLVVWEAQYGDFANGAQAIIDEFIVSARDKWAQLPSLVMLLPHGHEGQGPDHSSGRPERFLQSAADNNLRLAYPTSAAQIFHLLRRQALLLRTDPLPLVVLTPKGLLRSPSVASSLQELSTGKWQPILVDATADPASVRRVILCSGRVYFDLKDALAKSSNAAQVLVIRVEQLYPLPVDEIADALSNYPNATEVLWLQEEPKNMGAFSFAESELRPILGGRAFGYAGRARRSNPAEGSMNWHKSNQAKILQTALDLSTPVQDWAGV